LAPTNNYDVTQPPDTQAANLLGQDLRNLALNVQQRMALISGPLANRWNPGADIQPANWTGLLYFATDTQQVFQWSGSAWVEITNTFILTTLLGSASVRLNGQSAAIPLTTLYAVPTSGIYRVCADCLVTTAGASGSIETIITWNNGISSQSIGMALATVTPVGSESTNSSFNFFASAGTNIQYNTQFISVFGSPRYSLNLRLEFLG